MTDTVLKILATCALVTLVSWAVLYSVFQAVGGDEIYFLMILSLGILSVLVVLVVGNYLKKQL